MTTYRDIFPSEYICADDLKGREVTLTIARIDFDAKTWISSKRQRCIALYFEGKTKGLKLNATNFDTISLKLGYGKEIENWVGKAITIYPSTDDRVRGDDKSCVRVRPHVPKPKVVVAGLAPAAQPAPAQPAAESESPAPVAATPEPTPASAAPTSVGSVSATPQPSTTTEPPKATTTTTGTNGNGNGHPKAEALASVIMTNTRDWNVACEELAENYPVYRDPKTNKPNYYRIRGRAVQLGYPVINGTNYEALIEKLAAQVVNETTPEAATPQAAPDFDDKIPF